MSRRFLLTALTIVPLMGCIPAQNNPGRYASSPAAPPAFASSLRGNSQSDKSLCQAVIHGKYAVARDLIERGASVNARDATGVPVIILATQNVLQIPRYGPMVDFVSSVKDPQAILDAARAKAIAFLGYLLSQKLAVNATAQEDKRHPSDAAFYGGGGRALTALDLAAFRSDKEACALLRMAGAKHRGK